MKFHCHYSNRWYCNKETLNLFEIHLVTVVYQESEEGRWLTFIQRTFETPEEAIAYQQKWLALSRELNP